MMFRRAEAELRRTVQMLSDIQVALNYSCIVVVMDPNGYVIYTNELAHQRFGRTDTSFTSIHYSKFLASDQQSVVEDIMSRVLNRQVWQGELRVSTSNGSTLWFQTTVVPYSSTDERANPYQYISISTDITAQKEAEMAQKERENQLITLINALPEGILFKDGEGRWLEANDKILSAFHISETDWRGKKDEDMASNPAVGKHIHPWRQLCEQAFSIGKPLQYETLRGTHRSARYIDGTIIPIFNDDGSRHGLVYIGRDVTDFKESQEELRRTTEELETIIETSADAISVTNLDGQILKVNDAFVGMYGWQREELLGQPVPFVSEMEKLEIQDWIIRVRMGERISSAETVRHRKDGTRLQVSITVSPVHDKEGNVIALSAISRDVTKQVADKELLYQSEKLSLVGKMAAGIAHEMKNPITSLKGFTQLIHERAIDAVQARYCSIMLNEYDRLQTILEELLLLSKPQHKDYKVSNLAHILNSVVSLLQMQANAKNILLNSNFESDILIMVAQNDLKQVFINILKNAIEASEFNTSIEIISYMGDTTQVIIEFQDHGCGIPEEQLEKIGEPFYTTKPEGTGLGMMVTQQIVKSHNGKLEITTEENVGTTVRVILPILTHTMSTNTARLDGKLSKL